VSKRHKKVSVYWKTYFQKEKKRKKEKKKASGFYSAVSCLAT
jgi:hypothetical protein